MIISCISQKHQKLGRLRDGEIEREIVGSCDLIQRITGKANVPFSFPNTATGIDRNFLYQILLENPFIGLLFDANFNELKYIIKPGEMNDAGEKVGEVAILYGEFLTNLIDFIIVAFVMFLIVKGVNKMKKPEAPPADPGPSEIDLLKEIRDSLKK